MMVEHLLLVISYNGNGDGDPPDRNKYGPPGT